MRRVRVELWLGGAATKVCGATYPIRHELRMLGMRWDGKQKCWVVDRVADEEVEGVLRRYGCWAVRSSSDYEVAFSSVIESVFLCPWRR